MSLTLAHYRCFYLHEHGRGDLSPFLRFCPPSHGLGFGGRYQPRGGGSGSVPHCTTVGASASVCFSCMTDAPPMYCRPSRRMPTVMAKSLMEITITSTPRNVARRPTG